MGMRIKSVGSYLPEKVVDNSFFSEDKKHYNEKLHDCFQGIESRHHSSDEETALSMAVAASMDALKNGEVNPREIDMILVNHHASMRLIPHDGYVLGKELGCRENISCVNHSTSCASFVSMLNTAHAYIKSGKCRKILLSCSYDWVNTGVDKSKDYSNLGDGAGAVIVEYASKEHFKSVREEVFYDYNRFISIDNAQRSGKKEYVYFGSGENLGLECILVGADSANKLMKTTGFNVEKIDWFVCHQPGRQVIDIWCHRLGIPSSKNLNTIKNCGNISAASIPVTLKHFIYEKPTIKRGDKLLFLAPGAGVHVSSMIFEY